MVKAKDLVKSQKQREDVKFETYNKIYLKIEKKIKLASDTNFYYTWYEIPEMLLGNHHYKLNECIEYVKKKIIDDGFKVKFTEPNILLIEWLPD